MMRKLDVPAEIGKLLEAAEAHDAGAIVYDENDEMLVVNQRYKNIYYYVDFTQPQSYRSIFWRGVEQAIVDDPVLQSSPRDWLNTAEDFRKTYAIAQYLISHNNGRTYLAHHQRFPGFGVLATRFDVTNRLHSSGLEFSAGQGGFDPIGGQWASSTLPKRYDLPTAIVTRSSKIIDANRLFLDIVDRRDGISLIGGRLVIDDPHVNRKVQEIVLERSGIGINDVSRMVRVSSLTSDECYILSISPMFSGFSAKERNMHGAALVHIVDYSEKPDVKNETLEDLFSLTAAEARVAKLIGAGMTVQEISNSNSVAEGTVRNQLKSIFQKMGVRKQSEVVGMIHRISVIENRKIAR